MNEYEQAEAAYVAAIDAHEAAIAAQDEAWLALRKAGERLLAARDSDAPDARFTGRDALDAVTDAIFRTFRRAV